MKTTSCDWLPKTNHQIFVIVDFPKKNTLISLVPLILLFTRYLVISGCPTTTIPRSTSTSLHELKISIAIEVVLVFDCFTYGIFDILNVNKPLLWNILSQRYRVMIEVICGLDCSTEDIFDCL